MKELINEVLDEFDFEKVHKAMKTLNWGWMRSNGKVPSIGQLVLCAQELLEDVSKMEVGYSIGTGGFKAAKVDSYDDGVGLELEFILTRGIYYKNWLEDK